MKKGITNAILLSDNLLETDDECEKGSKETEVEKFMTENGLSITGGDPDENWSH